MVRLVLLWAAPSSLSVALVRRVAGCYVELSPLGEGPFDAAHDTIAVAVAAGDCYMSAHLLACLLMH